MSETDKNNGASKFKVFLFMLIIVMVLFTCASQKRVGCHCNDGTESSATGRGACSHHGGVMYWKNEYWWDK
jgi:hypothetical protein